MIRCRPRIFDMAAIMYDTTNGEDIKRAVEATKRYGVKETRVNIIEVADKEGGGIQYMLPGEYIVIDHGMMVFVFDEEQFRERYRTDI